MPALPSVRLTASIPAPRLPSPAALNRSRIDSAAVDADQRVFASTLTHLIGESNVPIRAGVAIACSGGPDSLGLACLSAEWAVRNGVPILGLVVDHRLRPEATFEAESAIEALQKLGIPAITLTWDSPRTGHAAARKARYALLTNACRQHNIHHLLTGHSADDQAETVMLRLSRGSGLYGLAGMSAITQGQEVQILRPFLAWRRRHIARIAPRFGLIPVEDPSNRKREFARVRARHVLAGNLVGRHATERLLSLATAAQRWRRHVDAETNQLLTGAVAQLWWGGVELDRTAWSAASPWTAKRALAELLTQMARRPGRDGGLEAVYLLIISAQAEQDASVSVLTLWGCQVVESSDYTVLICREGPRHEVPTAWRPDTRFTPSETRSATELVPLPDDWRAHVSPDHPLHSVPVRALPGLPALVDATAKIVAWPVPPHRGHKGLLLDQDWLKPVAPFVVVDGVKAG